jgi:predicted transcriptional regulator of viral defense system
MYETELVDKLSKMPLFSLADVSQIVKSREYAKVVIRRMVKNEEVKRIKRDAYTFHEDPILVSTFLVKPSYVSSVSSLYLHKKITQIPNEVFCFTNNLPKKFFFVVPINFFHTDFFFGFELEKYGEFEILVATDEKAIIDSVGKVPLSVVEEAFEDLKIDRIIGYLKKIGKSSFAKRIGFLLERNGYDVYHELKGLIKGNYISLDPLIKSHKRKNRKWKVFI